MDLVHMKYLEVKITMVHVVEYRKDGTDYENIDGLFDGIPLQQEYGTEMISSVLVVYGELNMLNMESVIWFL